MRKEKCSFAEVSIFSSTCAFLIDDYSVVPYATKPTDNYAEEGGPGGLTFMKFYQDPLRS